MARQLARRRAPADTRPPRRTRREVEEDTVEDEYEDEEVEETPRRGRSSRREPKVTRRGSERVSKRPERDTEGWDAYKSTRSETSSFNSADRFTIDGAGDGLVKFLEDRPFHTLKQHWVERGKGEKKSWTCLGTKECPLDLLGEGSRLLTYFNIVDVDDGAHKYWEAGPQVGDQIADFADSETFAPINQDGLYFEVNKKKDKGGFWQYTLRPVFEDDRAWPDDVEPLTDDELDDALDHLFDRSVAEKPSIQALEAIAAEIEGDE